MATKKETTTARPTNKMTIKGWIATIAIGLVVSVAAGVGIVKIVDKINPGTKIEQSVDNVGGGTSESPGTSENPGTSETPDTPEVELTTEQKIYALAGVMFENRGDVKVKDCVVNNNCTIVAADGTSIEASKVVIDATLTSASGKTTTKVSSISVPATEETKAMDREELIDHVYDQIEEQNPDCVLSQENSPVLSKKISDSTTLYKNFKTYLGLSDSDVIVITDSYDEETDRRGNGSFVFHIDVYRDGKYFATYKTSLKYDVENKEALWNQHIKDAGEFDMNGFSSWSKAEITPGRSAELGR